MHKLHTLILILSFSLFAQQSKLNIAVNELKPQGLDKSAAGIISDRIRSELINTGVFRVMERTEMETILKEQGFQHTGVCDDQSCLIEVGQLLGVDRMVAGSVGKIGSIYTISLRMINVATGEILFTVNEDCDCPVSKVLSKSTANIAVKLAQGAGGEVTKAAMVGKVGDIYITTDQTGASVEIDGKKIPGETPLTLEGFPAGEHRIVLRKYNYFGSKNITLNPNDLLKLHIEMSMGKGELKVFTKPQGATVYVDGINMGITPIMIRDVAAGEHLVRIVKRGYITGQNRVKIEIGQTRSISLSLQHVAFVSVLADPKSAVIIINGNEAGRGVVSSYEVPAGDARIQVEAPGYEVFKKTVKLNTGDTERMEVKLLSSFGILSINSDPPGAEVYINDKKTGKTPYKNSRIVPGNYKINIKLRGYDDYGKSFTVEKGKVLNINPELISKFGKIEITSEPDQAHVFLNEKHVGQTPYSNYELTPGNYMLKVNMDSYRPVKEDITISKNQTIKKSYNLEHTEEYLDSIANAEKKVKKRRRNIRRVVFGIVAAGFGGAGAYFDMEAQELADEQKDIQEDYNSASSGFNGLAQEYDKKAEEAKEARTYRNIMYSAAGAFAIGFTISIPF